MMNKHTGEKEKRTASCALERDRTEEAKAVRNRLIRVASSPPRTIVMSKPGLCQGPSVFVVLPQPWSVLLSTAHIPTIGHTDAPGSGLPPMPNGHMSNPGLCRHRGQAFLTGLFFQPVPWVQTVAEGHVWFSDPTLARVCVNIHGPFSHKRPHRCPRIWATT